MGTLYILMFFLKQTEHASDIVINGKLASFIVPFFSELVYEVYKRCFFIV